ncbi:MAG TPA: class I SAM-dependent methyltransferase [Bacteroidales bacterium]|nr:class I SAM-dependent methyltransferase [Bacteroidales bacterium]
MKYEPIKASLGKVFNNIPVLRIIFYKMLDLLLLRAWHIKKELRKIKKQTGPNASVLDAGAGFGQYTYYMSTFSKGWSITGVDIIDAQIEDCNRFFAKINKSQQVKFEKADLTAFLRPESFDLITSVDVMEHIEDDRAVFSNFYKSLKKGGCVLISTPSDKGGSDAHDNDDHSFIAEHVRNGYNIDEIAEKLTTAGFSKVECLYQYGTPGKISWTLSMKFPIIMLNKTKLLFILLPFYYIVTFPFCFILNYFDLQMKHAEGTGLIVKAWK